MDSELSESGVCEPVYALRVTHWQLTHCCARSHRNVTVAAFTREGEVRLAATEGRARGGEGAACGVGYLPAWATAARHVDNDARGGELAAEQRQVRGDGVAALPLEVHVHERVGCEDREDEATALLPPLARGRERELPRHRVPQLPRDGEDGRPPLQLPRVMRIDEGRSSEEEAMQCRVALQTRWADVQVLQGAWGGG